MKSETTLLVTYTTKRRNGFAEKMFYYDCRNARVAVWTSRNLPRMRGQIITTLRCGAPYGGGGNGRGTFFTLAAAAAVTFSNVIVRVVIRPVFGERRPFRNIDNTVLSSAYRV